MADPTYCPWILEAPCLKPEVWAAWAQAFLAAAAIFAAGFIPTWQQRSRDRKVRADYIRLVENASATVELQMSTLALNQYDETQNRYLQPLLDFPAGVKEAFAFVRFDQLPDYALLPPVSDALQALNRFANSWHHVRTMSAVGMLQKEDQRRQIEELTATRAILSRCALDVRHAS
ncbi:MULTISPECIES: hypothetical protein [Xanthomonas]|uniref:hypothetical protein n=1 Tax=Xanthomonas TaxID=338 RepID=UPI001ADA2A70|nr:hypothetical protein [Xanthomonas phaseoli]MBO9766493.1 hypothetical protein [Xanthomonas phaseoli pv. dieffenbachiae]MBO9776162.1 hypothetical protein [Xanthomonas phaseoli pv. dieffenbachiae]MBO9778239.1 hypothetical protein [Xanthomonas phaseoli pv. dieffenbachiae]MBO9795372.1 hypothetical protein [Xanthomonas phaseoli pv. dieffenbachiae]MBO9801433.1 hypothetical protein [Xanthomonas phaseoli pv. dieffenbachiae]